MSLDEVFEKMESKKEELRIQDWAITNTTLEEVFLKISLQDKNHGDATQSVAFFSEDELAVSSKKKSKTKLSGAKSTSNVKEENGKEEENEADFSSSSDEEVHEEKERSLRTDESSELP